MPAPLHPQVEMVALDAFPLREPVSRRAYTCLRLRTRSGATGYGECSRLAAADLSALRAAIQGKEASSFQSIRRSLAVSASALAGLDMAMLDLLGSSPKRPCTRCSAAPLETRDARSPRIDGETDEAITAAVSNARAAGHKAFLIPIPATRSPNHSATLVNAARRRLERARAAVGDGCDFVLDAAGQLSPGDASTLAAAFERFHLLWFDEPCPLSNVSAAGRIAGENVTPVGFGRFTAEPGIFQICCAAMPSTWSVPISPDTASRKYGGFPLSRKRTTSQ